MFRALQRRVGDMATIRALCLAAEAHAHKDGQREPGAEHFLLAAFDLPDGTARRALERVGVAPEQFKAAIAVQYANALSAIGLTADIDAEPEAPGPAAGVYQAGPSGAEIMQKLAAQRPFGGPPLVGADVVAVVATLRRGVSAQALRTMDVDLEALRLAAIKESGAARSGSKPN